MHDTAATILFEQIAAQGHDAVQHHVGVDVNAGITVLMQVAIDQFERSHAPGNRHTIQPMTHLAAINDQIVRPHLHHNARMGTGQSRVARITVKVAINEAPCEADKRRIRGSDGQSCAGWSGHNRGVIQVNGQVLLVNDHPRVCFSWLQRDGVARIGGVYQWLQVAGGKHARNRGHPAQNCYPPPYLPDSVPAEAFYPVRQLCNHCRRAAFPFVKG